VLTQADGIDAKTVANWMTGDMFRLLNEDSVDREDIASTNITPENFGAMIALVEDGTINAQTARKKVLPLMWEKGTDAQQIVDDEGLAQVSDAGIIEEKVQEAMDANPDMVEKYLDGNDKVINAIFGRTMGLLRGQGDPGVVRKVLQEKLDALKDA
ncbi:MAG: Asp-tRNA(Asn)/Glu-tRNA(Gln) amidotransferase GatCAB subunit B, partial [Chloroflexota bacterium]